MREADQPAPLETTGQRLARNQIGQEAGRLLAETKECPAGFAEPLRQLSLASLYAGIDLATIATAGAEADCFGLQQGDFCAGLCGMQRRRQASETAADDGKLDIGLALQRRLGWRRHRCRGRPQAGRQSLLRRAHHERFTASVSSS